MSTKPVEGNRFSPPWDALTAFLRIFEIDYDTVQHSAGE